MAQHPARDVNLCSVCDLHQDAEACARYEIGRGAHWILRHHPDPAALVGWLLLDSDRHLSGPLEFTAEEASGWGAEVQRASRLVQRITGCDRVYAIAFGEGARHLHLHLIPRFGGDPASEAWNVADLYRAVACSKRPSADPKLVQAFVKEARHLWSQQGQGP